MRRTGLAFLVLLGMFTASTLCLNRTEAAALRHRVLPVILPPVLYNQPPAALSSDGRWLAFFDVRKGRDVAVFYSLATNRSWAVDLEKHTNAGPGYGMDESPDLVWCPDRSVCAVSTERGWALAAPNRRRLRRLPRASLYAGTVSWSPRSGHLALFGFDGLFQFWDGHRLRHGPDWMKTLHIPEYAAERTWQSEWSPDGRQIFLRFYGHADRGSNSPGHMLILRPDTRHPHYQLTEEAGPTHWLDTHRLVFKGDDYYGAEPAPLKVARPTTLTSKIWLKDVMGWTLSPQHTALWALTGKGILYQTAMRRPVWRRIGRYVRQSAGTNLTLSPKGDWLALSEAQTSPLLIPVGSERIKRKAWTAPSGAVILGWPVGQEYPLLAVPWRKEQWQIWQMQRRSYRNAE